MEEEDKIMTDTIKVFSMSMGLENGGISRRDIKRGGSTEGAINTSTFLGLGAPMLTT